jgi:nicotinamidase/pyrazinamidase
MTNHESYNHLISITVDVQNDFCPGGALAVPTGDEVIEPLNQLNNWVRSRGNVYFTRDWHQRNSKHFIENGGEWPRHCIAYTAGAAFPDNLDIQVGRDSVINKGVDPEDPGYSGFSERAVFEESPWMYYNNLKTLSEYQLNHYYPRIAFLIGGLAIDYCVKATTLDIFNSLPRQVEQIGVFVVKDAIRAVNLSVGDGAKAIQAMETAGATLVTVEQVMNGEIFDLSLRGKYHD